MDISTLTQQEVEDLLMRVHARLDQMRLEAHEEQSGRTARIEDSISALDTLLGPEGAPPGTGSVRAVRGFDGQTMSDNATIAFPLAFEGLEILTRVVRDLASSIVAK